MKYQEIFFKVIFFQYLLLHYSLFNSMDANIYCSHQMISLERKTYGILFLNPDHAKICLCLSLYIISFMHSYNMM